MVKISGQNLFITRRFVAQKHGEETLRKVLDRMPKASRDTVEATIDVRDMYDVRVIEDLMKAIAEVLGRDELKAVGAFTLDSQVKLLGILIRFYSVDRAIEKFKEAYPKIYSEGTLVVTREGDAIAVDINGVSLPEHLCIGAMYYMEELLKRVTGKNVVSALSRKKDSQEFRYVIMGDSN